MKNQYLKYYADDLWSIKEDGFEPEIQNIRETQFSLGNGYVGVRGALEEKPKGSNPGTYIAGIYDRLTSQVSELVNFPNPFFFKFTLKGEKFGAMAMDILEHHRVLNMRDGILLRRTVYSDVKSRRYDYQSIRFISMKDKNIGIMQVVLTPLDSNVEIQAQSVIDTSVFNSGMITEGDKKHFHVRELTHEDHSSYRLIETLEKHIQVIYRSGFYYKIGSKRTNATDNILSIKLKKNQPVTFTRVFHIKSFSQDENIKKVKKDSHTQYHEAFRTKFETHLKNHTEQWHKLWDRADVVIEGTADIQKNLRFNIFHMLICAHYDEGFSSLGARTLSGEGYRGHIFWDTEIFMLPFYAYVQPEIAKNMLLYRYNRLGEAKKIAKTQGCRGSMYPWESAGTGEEETPTWAKDLDGTIIRIKTNKLEHHITADIAYACMQYVAISGDEEFMNHSGYEIMFESARFWASRVTKNRQGQYEIRDVIGPDEFHVHVDNNAFTNMMAKRNLVISHKLYCELQQKDQILFKALKIKIGLTDKEASHWKFISSRIVFKKRKDLVIEQFDGFFRRRYIKIHNFDENGIPLLPKGVRVKDYNKTQFVKQADVLMLLYLLSDMYDKRTKEKNFWFYINRTLHKSSLSPAMHSLMALEVGALSHAYQFFNVALRADISNLHDNTAEGIHAASLGGAWQCVVNGFAGIRLKREILAINPLMPRTWRKICCSILWKKQLVRIETKLNEVVVKIESKTKSKIKVEIFGKPHILSANKRHVFARPKFKKQENYYL